VATSGGGAQGVAVVEPGAVEARDGGYGELQTELTNRRQIRGRGRATTEVGGEAQDWRWWPSGADRCGGGRWPKPTCVA
jgi:hypothetical protein